MIGDFAPKLVELTDEVLFGDIWESPGLSRRDRRFVTVTAHREDHQSESEHRRFVEIRSRQRRG
jgi:hypothetical protein